MQSKLSRLKFALLASLTLCAVGSALAQHSYPKPQTPSASGQAAPDFTLPDQDGKPLKLSSLHGQPVLIYFYRGYW